MASAAPQLEYAPAAPIRRRKRIRRLIYVSLLLVVGFLAWKYHAPVWHQAKLLYYEQQCLTYTAPSDQVVYEEVDGAVSPLVNAPGYTAMAAQPDYSIWNVTRNTGTVAGRIALPLKEYAALYGGPVPFTSATIFMHELRNKAGMKRLVVVTRRPERAGIYLHAFGLQPDVIKPAGMKSPPELYRFPIATGMRLGEDETPPTQRLRFYAGQLDPADPARFTIKYDLMNQSGLIEGRLKEDGNTVLLTILSGPALKTKWANDVIFKD